MADEIKKFITILLNIRGHKEVGEEAEKAFKKQHDGMGQAKKDADEGSDKIITFLGRWKSELMLVGGAVAGIYALVRYSSVANTMMDLFGRSVGFLADLILIRLLPGVLYLTSWILWLGKAFQGLPDILKDVISWGVGTVVAFGLIAKALDMMGVSAVTSKLLLGGLAGLVIGVEIVLILRELGFFKALGDIIGNAKAAFQNWMDNLELNWDNMWINAFNFLITKYNETLGNLPGAMKIAPIKNLDEYDKFQKDLAKYAGQFGGGRAGGRSETKDNNGGPDTSGLSEVYKDMIARGLTPEQYVNLMRKTGTPIAGYEFVPPDAKWNPENDPLKDYLSWGYNYKDSKTGFPKVPGPGGATEYPTPQGSGISPVNQTPSQFNIAKGLPAWGWDTEGTGAKMPAPPGSKGGTEYPTPQGSGISPVNQTPSQFNITISNMELNPNTPGNKEFYDEVLNKVNQSQGIAQRKVNFYG